MILYIVWQVFEVVKAYFTAVLS